jgi:hypothetical protein
MSSTTNFPNGVTNVERFQAMGRLLFPDPTKCYTWFDDFDEYVSGNWTLTETQAGATQAIIDGDGGQLALVNSAADNDLNQIQWLRETFRLGFTRQVWIKTRFKVSNATQSDVLIGLYITDTSPVASKPTDGFFFQKLDDSTTMTFEIGKNSVYTSTTVGTIADDTFVEVAAYLEPVTQTVSLFYNNSMVARAPITNLCDDEELAVSIAIQNGDAVARTLTVDYLLVSEER